MSGAKNGTSSLLVHLPSVISYLVTNSPKRICFKCKRCILLSFTLWLITNSSSVIFHISLPVFLLLFFLLLCIFKLLYFTFLAFPWLFNNSFQGSAEGKHWVMMGVAERVCLSLDRLCGRFVALTVDADLTDISLECGIHNTSSPSVLGLHAQFQGNKEHHLKCCHRYITLFNYPQIHFSPIWEKWRSESLSSLSEGPQRVVVDLVFKIRPDWV